MKTAILSRDALNASLNIVNQIIEKRSPVPILSNVRMVARGGRLLLTGTDLDIETTVILAPLSVDSDFAATIAAHSLADAIKKTPMGADITIECVNGDTQGDCDAALVFEGSRTALQSLPERNFPLMSAQQDAIEFEMSTADLRAALESVAFAISTEKTRYYLNGVYVHTVQSGGISELRVVATDGRRLAIHSIELADGAPCVKGMIVPRKTILHLIRLTKGKGSPSTVRIGIGRAKARFDIGNVTVVTKLIDGTFPDYARVVPERGALETTIDRVAISAAAKSLRTASDKKEPVLKIETIRSGGALTLRLSLRDEAGIAHRDVPASGAAESDFTVGVNAKHLIDILAAESFDAVTMCVSTPRSAILFCGRTTCVLMPTHL